MNIEEYTAVIGQHFIVALVNGDISHLTDEEDAQLTEWEKGYLEEGKSISYDFSEDTYFGSCDVTRLGGDVVDVTITVIK